jgi:hypothetical protein
MSGEPKLRQHGAVGIFDQAVDDRLGMDEDVDPLLGSRTEWCASISSSPLFIMVALSTRDLGAHGPVGVGHGLGGSDRAIASRLKVRNGPSAGGQDQAETRSQSWPARHWKIALCSLSSGSRVAPVRWLLDHQRAGGDERFLIGERDACCRDGRRP